MVEATLRTGKMKSLQTWVRMMIGRFQFSLPETRSLPQLEWIAIFLVSLGLTLVCTRLEHRVWLGGKADTAFLTSLVDEMASTGKTQSPLAGSIFEALDLLGKPAAEVCRSPLPLPAQDIDFFRRAHPYFVLYLISPFARHLPSEWLLSSLMALSLVSLLVFAYVLLRLWGVSYWVASLFTLLVACHPVWSGGLVGQFYVDRLFALAGALLCLMLTVWRGEIFGWKRWLAFSTLLLFALSINDRIGVVCALGLGCFALMHKSDRRIKIGIGALAIFSFMVSVYLLKFYVERFSYNENFNSIPKILAYLNYTLNAYSNPLTQWQVLTFLGINFVLFAHWARYRWQTLLLVLAVMLPNLVYSVGGAEKTGWSTHYHSMYFPFLIWAAALGVAEMWRLNSSRLKRVLIGLALLANALVLTFVPNDWGVALQLTRPRDTWIARAVRHYQNYQETAVKIAALKAAIPEGKTISTVESFMTVWHAKSRVLYWPTGIEVADYAVLRRNEENGHFEGFFSLLGDVETQRLQECMLARMRYEGFDIDNPTILGAAAVFRRASTTKVSDPKH
jgi:multisubunit Na+/H+ antiporter MnhC subunit